jgi:hypothetical protein
MGEVSSAGIPLGEPVLLHKAGSTALTALGTGIAGEQLIHGMVFDNASPGLGLTLLLLLPITVVASGRWLIGVGPSTPSLLLLGAAAVFAVFPTLRDAGPLLTVNVITVIVLLLLAVHVYRNGQLRSLEISDYVSIGLLGPFVVAAEPASFLVADLGGLRERWRSLGRLARSIIRGIALAVIPLAVFGALLASADAVFSNLLKNAFSHDIQGERLLGAAALGIVITWMTLGSLRYAAGHSHFDREESRWRYLGRVETVAMLAPLILLFAIFVVIQFTYLFGGVDTIAATGGLTRAEYARQGFFQLVWVAALVTALVLIVDWWHRPADEKPGLAVSGLFAALIALTGVMVASALVRMKLYVDAFGLTELRLYTTALMIWITMLLILALPTVLRGRRRAFALGGLISVLIVTFGLNLANPDGLIARVNIDRHASASIQLDADYLGSELSADAVPTIIDRLDDVDDPCLRYELALAAMQIDTRTMGGWRSSNLARSSASDALHGLMVERPASCN